MSLPDAMGSQQLADILSMYQGVNLSTIQSLPQSRDAPEMTAQLCNAPVNGFSSCAAGSATMESELLRLGVQGMHADGAAAWLPAPSYFDPALFRRHRESEASGDPAAGSEQSTGGAPKSGSNKTLYCIDTDAYPTIRDAQMVIAMTPTTG